MREKNERALVLAAAGALLAAVLTGCSMFNNRDEQMTTTSMTVTTTRRTVVTTKTAVRELTPDTDDEDFDGYTTTTAFKKDALYQLSDTNSYDGTRSYKVTSDTTYLNLRFGPSRNYDVQLKIPDGDTVTGYGQTTEDSTGEKWVYIDYKGTNGWVMKKLLKEQ